jgi:hypothetical protein
MGQFIFLHLRVLAFVFVDLRKQLHDLRSQ